MSWLLTDPALKHNRAPDSSPTLACAHVADIIEGYPSALQNAAYSLRKAALAWHGLQQQL
jgi:hypothetical protein